MVFDFTFNIICVLAQRYYPWCLSSGISNYLNFYAMQSKLLSAKKSRGGCHRLYPTATWPNWTHVHPFQTIFFFLMYTFSAFAWNWFISTLLLSLYTSFKRSVLYSIGKRQKCLQKRVFFFFFLLTITVARDTKTYCPLYDHFRCTCTC